MSRARPVAPTRADVLDASTRIAGLVRRVSLVESPNLGQGSVVAIETLQPTGSFKVRGALAALMPLASGTRVVAASTGNHALAIAHAAEVLELEAAVVVPQSVSPAKLSALAAFPAVEVTKYGKSFDEAERHALKLAAKSGRYISPYNDRLVIAGQGSLAVELLKRLDGSLTVVCPVGGGGLAAGVALWATQRSGVRVIGVNVDASTAMAKAIAADKISRVKVGETLADSLAGNLEQGAVTFDLVKRYVERIVTVSEKELESGMRYLAVEHGLIVEGAGAVAAAAALAGKVEAESGRLVSLVTGRNVAPQVIARVLRSRGR